MNHANQENYKKNAAHLNELLAENIDAKQFFMTLPEDAQGALFQNAGQIHTIEDLHVIKTQNGPALPRK